MEVTVIATLNNGFLTVSEPYAKQDNDYFHENDKYKLLTEDKCFPIYEVKKLQQTFKITRLGYIVRVKVNKDINLKSLDDYVRQFEF